MDTFDIDLYFQGGDAYFSEVKKSFEEITAIQNGKISVLKTGFEPLDLNLITGASNKMIFIGARPGHGKTHNCETIIDNLQNRDLNVGKNVKILRMNLEMPTKALIFRAMKKVLKKPLKEILAAPFTEDERLLIKNNVYDKFRDPNILNFSESVDGQSLVYLIDKFISSCNSEDEAIILVDHLHVYHDKTTIDSVLKICNEAKMRYSNLTFIFYFQLNRTLEDSWRDVKNNKANQRNMLPHPGHIYLTDMLQQYADIVLGITIPQIAGLDEFAVINKEVNKHLEKDFIPGKSEGKYGTLKSRNRVYYNIIKLRGVDDFDFPTIYSQVLDPSKEVNLVSEDEEFTPMFNPMSSALKNAREDFSDPEEFEDPF